MEKVMILQKNEGFKLNNNKELDAVLSNDMLAELEKTIIKINKGEEDFITYEDWKKEMRRKYNANI